MQQIALKIQNLPTHTINALVSDIAKKTKKKRLSSGTATFNQYCTMIAETLTKPATKELVAKYDLL